MPDTARIEPASLHHCRRAHHRSAEPGALGHGLCGLPQADGGDRARNRRKDTRPLCTAVEGPWTVSSSRTAERRRHHARPRLPRGATTARCRREVLLRHRNLYHEPSTRLAEWFAKGAHIWIDLGEREEPGRSRSERQAAGHRLACALSRGCNGALKPGANQVSVKVTNAWVNRLIGDEQPGATKYTFTDVKPYKANSPLQASGLLGPVAVVRSAKE